MTEKQFLARLDDYGNISGICDMPEDFHDTKNYLVYVGPSDRGDGLLDAIRLKKGSWDIMDAFIPKILKYVPGPIVEIGMGESTTIFANHAYQAGVVLYSCDIEMGGMFKVFDKPLFEQHVCFIGKSEDFIKGFKDEPSIVFLDGEHCYAAVKREVDFFLPLIKEGGVLFMHDTFPPLERQIVPDKFGRKPGDVYKARRELENNPDVDVFTFPYSAHNMGLTMVMKHQKNKYRKHWQRNGRLNEIN
uniref:Putative methyltransferase n=2 Tax=viral metagenome TaxID=1070528 RepID=A0A6M3XPR7_9ZZZZ